MRLAPKGRVAAKEKEKNQSMSRELVKALFIYFEAK
jgi:hypothetical protein